MQQASEARNANLPEDRRMSFRIGINLSDVIVEQNDVFGDGVNVASRLQAIAEPGSIFISESVYQQVQRQLPLSFEDAGKRQLKDTSGLTQAWRVAGQHCRRAAARRATAHQASIAVLPFINMSRRPGAGLFQRRHHRGHHHRPLEDLRPLRGLAQHRLHLQGHDAKTSTGWRRGWACNTCSRAACGR